MAVSFSCKCEERKKPLVDRDWQVWQYRCNHSAFNGYHSTPSDYSTVLCNRCRSIGRTKAAFVVQLVALGKIRK